MSVAIITGIHALFSLKNFNLHLESKMFSLNILIYVLSLKLTL